MEVTAPLVARMPGRVRLSQPSDLVTRATRLFRAPIERVYRVFTDPAYAPVVWADNPADVNVEEMDLRPGGRYALTVRGSDGATTRFHGEYLEVVPPRRIVNTFHVSALPGVRAVETDEFESVGPSTRLTVSWTFDTREDRDRMYGPELEEGLTASWDRVERAMGTMSDSALTRH